MSEPEVWRYNVTRLSPTKSKVGSYVSSEDYDSLAATVKALREERAELITALRKLLTFNEELCADVGVSKHYPSAENARRLLDRLASPSVPAEEE